LLAFFRASKRVLSLFRERRKIARVEKEKMSKKYKSISTK
jgi:hypothetical protein